MVSTLLERLTAALFADGNLSIRDLELLDAVAGLNRDAVNALLNRYRGRISAQTKSAIVEALKTADDGDTEILHMLYPGVALISSTSAVQRIAQETAEGVAQIIARDNLMMAHHAQDVWLDVAGEAITQWNHGGDTPDRIIGRAVRRLQSEGLTVIDYKSGIRSQTDVAVRRHIVSQVGQASGRMTMARCEDAGHDLVQTSAHFGARPAHAAWQGRVFSLSGRSKKYPDFRGVTGYGTGPGLQGWNCKHTFGMYFEGITELPTLPDKVRGMSNDEYYGATQTLRRHENGIRNTKREIAGIQQAGGDATEGRLKLGRQQAKLRAHVEATGVPRIPKREKAYGIGNEQPRALTRAAS